MLRKRPLSILASAPRDDAREFRITACAAGPVAIAAAEGEGDAQKLATFKGNAYTGAPMKPQGWWTPIVVDLDGVVIPSQHRPALRQHDHEQIVGHTTSVKASPKDGIPVEGVFSGQTEHVEKVTVPARNGFQWQLSIGANPVRTEWLEAGESTEVNGRTVTGPLTISRETELGEISFVPLGADGNTTADVSASKGRDGMNTKALLKFARAQGVTAATKYSDDEIDKMSDDDAKAALKKCMKGADDEDDATKKKKAADDADAKAALTQMFAAFTTQSVEAMRKAQADESQRVADIRVRAARHGVTSIEVEAEGKKSKVDLVTHAIAAGWTPDTVELHALRAARPGPGVGMVPGGLAYSTSTPELSEAVLEAAVIHAARHQFKLDDDSFYIDAETKQRRVPHHIEQDAKRDLKARYTDQVQQAAHTMFRGRISLQQVLVASARVNGYHGSEVIRDDGAIEDVLRAQNWKMSRAGQGIQAEGTSTASIANILSNVLNKFMLQGYLFVEQAWREIAAIRPVNDFKPTKSINLLGDVMFKKVADSGELKDASLGDQAFANQADQYGRILTINRKNIINDDLGILTTAPMKLGQGAGLVLNDVLWTIFLALVSATADDGTAFWRTTSSTVAGKLSGPNKLTGGGSALSSAALQAAKQLFDKQTDPNGNPLGYDGMTPILLFPPELWMTANELVDPAAVGLVYGGGSAAKQPNINMWKGRLKPVMSRYLSNTNYANASATAWYNLFAPVALAVIEACFLNGVDTPTVQTASPEFQFDRLGVSIRGVLDFGVNAQNFRAGVRSDGA